MTTGHRFSLHKRTLLRDGRRALVLTSQYEGMTPNEQQALRERIVDLLNGDDGGWRRLPDTATRTCDAFNGRYWLVADDSNGTVGEARYFPEEAGWWWAGHDPTDATDGRCHPTHYRPLPAPPPHPDPVIPG